MTLYCRMRVSLEVLKEMVMNPTDSETWHACRKDCFVLIQSHTPELTTNSLVPKPQSASSGFHSPPLCQERKTLFHGAVVGMIASRLTDLQHRWSPSPWSPPRLKRTLPWPIPASYPACDLENGAGNLPYHQNEASHQNTMPVS